MMDKQRIVRCAGPTSQELGAVLSYEELRLEQEYEGEEDCKHLEQQQEEVEG